MSRRSFDTPVWFDAHRANDFQFLSRYPVSVAIQIYSSRSEVHDRITRDPDDFECTVNVVQQLKEAGITFSFDLVVLKDNQDHWEETLSFFSDFEPLNILRNSKHWKAMAESGLKYNPMLEDVRAAESIMQLVS